MHVKRTVTDDLAGKKERLPITVKNTFITVNLPVVSRPLRKSSSLPELLRNGEHLEAKPYQSNDFGVFPAGNSDGEPCEPVSEGFCTDSEDDRAFVPSAVACGYPACQVPPWLAPDKGEPVGETAVDEDAEAHQRRGVVLSVDQLVAVEARVTEEHGEVQPVMQEQVAARSRLSAKARAWEPANATNASSAACAGGAASAAIAQTPVQMQQNWPVPPAPQLASTFGDPMGQFQQDVAAVVMAVKSSLECSGFDICVDLAEHNQGWLVTVKVHSHDMHRAEYMITVAKETLLMSTDEASKVKVIGYRLVPFLPTPQGFLAMLGAVPDHSQACYDAYGKGFCRRGAACRWQHPPCMRSVKVGIVCHGN
jgi:hypothetical protein